MTIEDIINGNVGQPVGPTKEWKNGHIITRYYAGPRPRWIRSIIFAGREIPLHPLVDVNGWEDSERKPMQGKGENDGYYRYY